MMNHATTEVFFDNMKIPADSLVGEEGNGFRYILAGMNAERILIASGMHRRRQMVHREGVGLRKRGVLFNRPIGQNQGVQFPIARAYMQMRAAELMVHEAARLYAAGADCGEAGQHGEAACRPKPPGPRPTCACRPTAASASPRSSTSSASSARRGFIRSRRSRPTWPVLHRRARAWLAEIVLGCSGGGAAVTSPRLRGLRHSRNYDSARDCVVIQGLRWVPEAVPCHLETFGLRSEPIG